MPRAGWVKPDEDHRLSDHLAFAVLARVFPPDVVDGVIAEVGRLQRRTRILPSRTVVYYVLGLALFSQSSYDEVIRLVIAGQAWSSGWSQSPPAPTKAALYKARQRLGPEPLQVLFDSVAVPMTSVGRSIGFHRGRRVMGVDGVSLEVPATAANRAEFTDTAQTSAILSALPTVHVLGLTELGSGAIVGAAIVSRGADEDRLVADLISTPAPDQLILAGPELYSPARWGAAVATGAHWLWELPVDAAIPADQPRTIEHIGEPDAAHAPTIRRFVTTIPQSENLPASEVVHLFASRRSMATAFDEFRAHHNSPRIVLRSKLPTGVRQEIYGYLCTYYAMRWIVNAPEADRQDDAEPLTGGDGTRGGRLSIHARG